MGFCHTILTVSAVFLVLPGSAMPAQRSYCLSCHASHYEAQGNCISCHRGNDRTDRKDIAHDNVIAGRFASFTLQGSAAVKRGQELVDVLACRRCHIYEKKGTRLATDLSRLASKTAPQSIFDSIRTPVFFMPNFFCDDRQTTALVNAILSGVEPAGAKAAETAQVVHFEDDQVSRENSFVTLCGPCHKSLSERSGGLGKGDIGPNLSALFSEYYPKTYRDAESWTQKKLKKWLSNPRDIRVNARMKPVRPTDSEFELLIKTMRIGTAAYPWR